VQVDAHLHQAAGSGPVNASDTAEWSTVNSVATVLVGLAILAGILGIVVPVLPGALLSLAAILVWALEIQSPTAWIVLAAATVLIGTSQVVKYIVPERRLRESGCRDARR
jgi:uncharacterized protein YqgC (DUF456 family)